MSQRGWRAENIRLTLRCLGVSSLDGLKKRQPPRRGVSLTVPSPPFKVGSTEYSVLRTKYSANAISPATSGITHHISHMMPISVVAPQSRQGRHASQQ